MEVAFGDLPECRADPVLLTQVYVNLLSNALKFTRGRWGARIEVGSLTEEGETVYTVRGNGAGFEMQYAPMIFDAFQRLERREDYEGTGERPDPGPAHRAPPRRTRLGRERARRRGNAVLHTQGGGRRWTQQRLTSCWLKAICRTWS